VGVNVATAVSSNSQIEKGNISIPIFLNSHHESQTQHCLYFTTVPVKRGSISQRMFAPELRKSGKLTRGYLKSAQERLLQEGSVTSSQLTW